MLKQVQLISTDFYMQNKTEADMEMVVVMISTASLLVLMHSKSINLRQTDIMLTALRAYYPENNAPSLCELAQMLTDQMAAMNKLTVPVDRLCNDIGRYADKVGLDLNERLEIVIGVLALALLSDKEDEKLWHLIGALRHNMGISNEIAPGDDLMKDARIYARIKGLNSHSEENESAHQILSEALSRTNFEFF